MKTATHVRSTCRSGFTLVEAVSAVALLGITLTASISSFSFVTRNERLIAVQGELDMDASLLVERLRRDLWRSSRPLIMVHPPGDGPYQAISFPIVGGTGPILHNDDGEIEWTATVVYHLKDGSPSEVRRTTFSPYTELTDVERQQQLADVVRDGNGQNTYNSGNASTRTLIENPVEWELNVNGSRFDAYAPEEDRRTFRLGTAMTETGNNYLTFRAVGKNADNTGSSRRLGVDTITMSASGLQREGEWQTYSSAGATPVVENMGEGEVWSGNSRLGFPATQNDAEFTLLLENDRWEERNFYYGGALFNDVARFFIQPSDRPHTFAIRLDGNGIAWHATNQTRNASTSYSDMNALDEVAMRILVRGNDLVDFDGFDGGWISFNGTNLWARFSRSSSAGMNIKKAFIAQSAIMLDPTNNPMNIVPGTQKTFFFGGSESQHFVAPTTPAPMETDKLSYLIEKTNSYVVGIYLSKNSYGNMRPAVYPNAADAGGPNCRLIVNPTADQVAEDFDWGSLPTEEMLDTHWSDWGAIPSNTVMSTRRIIALNSLRAGHSPEGTYVSRIVDTRLDNPSYLTFAWVGSQPSNSTLEVKIRASASWTNLSATVWTNVPLATSGVAPGINGRFVQVWVRMKPGTDALSSSELQDFTLRWLGQRRYNDVSGIFSVGPNHGIYEVQVNGAPLLQGVTVKVSVFKEVSRGYGSAQRLVSSAFAEIVPRN